MVARFALIAAAVLFGAPAAAAEPVKPVQQPVQQPSQSAAPAPQILLASANAVQTEASQEPSASAPRPRRIARVTSCRCGDAQPQPDREQ